MKALESGRIILHCSATFADMDIDVHDIRQWHVDGRGWRDVGYNFVIKRDGTVQRGRDLTIAGAHTRGHNNSIGVCYVGGLDEHGEPEDNMTELQEIALFDLVRSLRTIFGKLTLHGHNEYANKACPSFDVMQKYGASFCLRNDPKP